MLQKDTSRRGRELDWSSREVRWEGGEDTCEFDTVPQKDMAEGVATRRERVPERASARLRCCRKGPQKSVSRPDARELDQLRARLAAKRGCDRVRLARDAASGRAYPHVAEVSSVHPIPVLVLTRAFLRSLLVFARPPQLSPKRFLH